MHLWKRFCAWAQDERSFPEDRLFWRFMIFLDGLLYLDRWSLKLPGGWRAALHIFYNGDGDRCLHDHPWRFWTFCLWGGYTEIVRRDDGSTYTHLVLPGTLHHRPLEFTHTVLHLHRRRAVTLVLTGPKRRSWGFVLPSGTRLGWRAFVKQGKAVRALWCGRDG